MNAQSNIAWIRNLTPADIFTDGGISEALTKFRDAFNRKFWLMLGTLPKLPAMTHAEAEQARADAYDYFTRDWRPTARELYETTVEAVLQAEADHELSKPWEA